MSIYRYERRVWLALNGKDGIKSSEQILPANKKRLVSGVVLVMLMVNVLALSFNVKPAASSPATLVVPDDYATIQAAVDAASPGDTVYVRAGTYTESVVVGKSLSLVGENPQSTIIDGGGVGSVVNIATDYVNVTGFTVQNSSAVWPNAGISIDGANYCNISGNNITNNRYGIFLYDSSGTSITGNNITAKGGHGIELYDSSGTSITGNTFTNDGLCVLYSYQNSVESNTVNGRPLVYLEGVSNHTVTDAGQVVLVRCDNIRVEGLNLSHTDAGVRLWETSNSTISGNNITANNGYGGIFLTYSSGNSITGNDITDNRYHGIGLSRSSGNSITGNNITASHDDGIGLDYSSSYNSISGNNITANIVGISLWPSSNNSITGNNITANHGDGILLGSSSGNSITGNNIANNRYGIRLVDSSGNMLYHNDFVDNAQQVYSSNSTNVWGNGYPSGGNYWSDYTGVDEKSGANQDQPGSDGIEDIAYTIDANNIDRYPLMSQSSISNFSLAGTGPVNVAFMSNSTVGNVQIDESARSLSFNVSGPTGTSGFCRIVLPNLVVESLWGGNYTVLINGESSPFTSSSDSKNTYIYISYTHSEHEVVIIPEFQLPFTILALMAVTILLIRKQEKKGH